MKKPSITLAIILNVYYKRTLSYEIQGVNFVIDKKTVLFSPIVTNIYLFRSLGDTYLYGSSKMSSFIDA